MIFEHFAQRVAAAGLSPVECSRHHWQIRGGRQLVNVWANAKRGFRMQADGQKSQRGDVAAAIRLAGPPEKKEKPPPRREQPVQRVGLIRWLWHRLW